MAAAKRRDQRSCNSSFSSSAAACKIAIAYFQAWRLRIGASVSQTLAGSLPKLPLPLDAFRLHPVTDEKADQVLGEIAKNVGEIAGSVSNGLHKVPSELGLLVAERDKTVVTHLHLCSPSSSGQFTGASGARQSTPPSPSVRLPASRPMRSSVRAFLQARRRNDRPVPSRRRRHAPMQPRRPRAGTATRRSPSLGSDTTSALRRDQSLRQRPVQMQIRPTMSPIVHQSGSLAFSEQIDGTQRV